MNYADYIRRRVSTPSNGVITDANIFASVIEGGKCEVTYQVFDSTASFRIGFDDSTLIGYSKVSYPQAIASLVKIGWELLDHGATLVTVTIDGERWVCSREAPMTSQRLRRALEILTTQVALEPNGGVPIWLYVNDEKAQRVWFNSTVRQAGRHAYLGNLGKYLSAVLGAVVQVGERSVQAKAVSTRAEAPTVVSLSCFEAWGCRESPIARLNTIMRTYGLSTYLDMQLSGRDFTLPQLVFTINVGDVVWRFPLYGDNAVSSTAMLSMQTQVENILSSIRLKVRCRLGDVIAQEVRLDLD